MFVKRNDENGRKRDIFMSGNHVDSQHSWFYVVFKAFLTDQTAGRVPLFLLVL